MVSLGLALFIIGLIVVALAYILTGPPIAARLGWVCVVAGVLFVVVGYLVPALPHA